MLTGYRTPVSQERTETVAKKSSPIANMMSNAVTGILDPVSPPTGPETPAPLRTPPPTIPKISGSGRGRGNLANFKGKQAPPFSGKKNAY
jgi:hypothetical protein